MDDILEVMDSTLGELGVVTANRKLWHGLVHEVTNSRNRLNKQTTKYTHISITIPFKVLMKYQIKTDVPM